MNLPQPHGTPGFKKKVLTDLRVKRPNSSRIQLGISFLPNHDMIKKNEPSTIKVREYSNHNLSRTERLYPEC